MANTFKVKTNAAMPSSSGTPLTLYTCPGTDTNTKAIVLGLILCNVHTSQVTVSVHLESNTSDTESNENVKCSFFLLIISKFTIFPLFKPISEVICPKTPGL